MTPTIDALRAKYPALSFTLYAYSGEPCVLECINGDGKIFTFRGATEEAAIMAGFADDFAAPAAVAAPPTNVFE